MKPTTIPMTNAIRALNAAKVKYPAELQARTVMIISLRMENVKAFFRTQHTPVSFV